MNPSREIAYTPCGRNALVTGLIGHIAAMLAGMTTAAGGELYVTIVYPFSWLILIVAAYAEWKHRGYDPARDGRFYGIAVVTIIPLIGPFALLVRLYRLPKRGEDKSRISGLFSALGRLKANGLVMFAAILFLFLLFAFLHRQEDPYFKREKTGVKSLFLTFQRVANSDGVAVCLSEHLKVIVFG